MNANTLTYKEAPEEKLNTDVRHTEAGFMQKVLDACPGAVAVIKGDAPEPVYVNRYFNELFGTPKSIYELFENDISGSDAIGKLNIHFHSTEANAARRYQLYRLKTVAGDVGYFYLYVSPFGNDEGAQPEYYQVMLLPEVSNSNLPFLSLDSREVFLEDFNRMGFGTFEWHPDKDMLLWSAGVYKIYEMEPAVGEMDKDYAASMLHPEDNIVITERFGALAEGRIDEVQTDIRVKTAKGNQKMLRVNARAVHAENRLLKLVGSLRDITDERTAQLALQKNMEDLYHSNKELEEFAYVASHDLQEPLRKITTFCDRLSERYKDILDGEGSMYMGRITASAENMRTLINNLLEFSRIAKYEQAFASVNLAFILKEVIHELELPITETGAKVSGVDLPTVDASFTQMKQLFTNIINNAIKFRSAGRVPQIKAEGAVATDAEMSRYHLNPNCKYYRITISDNGMGFENEYAQRIFQIFQRLHGKSEYPGSGIGLAICKKIVERHNGHIYAEGQPDAGAKFVFYLPEKQH